MQTSRSSNPSARQIVHLIPLHHLPFVVYLAHHSTLLIRHLSTIGRRPSSACRATLGLLSARLPRMRILSAPSLYSNNLPLLSLCPFAYFFLSFFYAQFTSFQLFFITSTHWIHLSIILSFHLAKYDLLKLRPCSHHPVVCRRHSSGCQLLDLDFANL